MLEYESVHFNWFEDIREYRYFLQSLLWIVCNRNLFSCWHFETSSHLLFKSSLWFGYMSIANFSWRYKEHLFVMFVYGAAVGIISHTNVAASFFIFFYFPSITWESCTIRIALVSKWLDEVIISLLFKGGLSGQMTWQFLNALELFSP